MRACACHAVYRQNADALREDLRRICQSVVADKLPGARRARSLGVQFLDGRTTTRCITFAEDLLKVALSSSWIRSFITYLLS